MIKSPKPSQGVDSSAPNRRSVAVIQTGGHQYLVRAGDELAVERLDAEPEARLSFSDLLHGNKVEVVVVSETRAPKVQVRKFKSKARYLRRRGHRQLQTAIRIDKIS